MPLPLDPLQSEEDKDIDDLNSNRPVQPNDWIIVHSMGEKIRQFVGNVISGDSFELSENFARRIMCGRFKWPENEDISTIDMEQVEANLPPPEFTIQNDSVI